MTYIPRGEVTDIISNKFEAIKVAALEARRLNERARMLGVNLPGKITSLAVRRLLEGEVEYFDEKERQAALEAARAAEEEAAEAAEDEEAEEEEAEED
jgi:hypothetical protein